LQAVAGFTEPGNTRALVVVFRKQTRFSRPTPPPPPNPLHMNRLALVPLFALALAIAPTTCATEAPRVFDSSPMLDPMAFFIGHTRSWGVMENSSGKATEIIRTETWGRVVHGELRMEQDLYFSKSPKQHRSWRMRRLDGRHFEASANDMVGTARGEARGNAFVWSFTLATKPGDPLFNIGMTQHMFLQPDGRTLINRDTVRKFGLIIAHVTEEFRHF
jgi:hypothetical protein